MASTEVANLPLPRASAFRRARPLVVYLTIIALDVWFLFILLDIGMNRGVSSAAISGTAAFDAYGKVWVPLLALAYLPAVVLSLALIVRTPPPAYRLERALAGGVAWGAWSAIILASAVALGGPVLFKASVLVGLLAMTISGALFGALGPAADTRPPRRALVYLGLAIVVVIVVGSILAAGSFWGGPT
jgi:hypothetical protein